MSVSFSCGERRFDINAWNWGVLHAIVAVGHKVGDFVPAEWERMRSGYGELLAEEVPQLVAVLETEVVPMIAPGQRIFFDGSVTDVPDDGKFFREESELWRNYSLSREVLDGVIAFLRGCDGPVSVG